MQITFNDRLISAVPVAVIGELTPVAIHGSENKRIVQGMKPTLQSIGVAVLGAHDHGVSFKSIRHSVVRGMIFKKYLVTTVENRCQVRVGADLTIRLLVLFPRQSAHFLFLRKKQPRRCQNLS